MNKLNISTLIALCVASTSAIAGMAVSDPISYTYFAQQLTEGAENTATNIKSLAEQTKQTVTQNEIFLTSKEIWTTARETQKVTEDAYEAVTGLYYTPSQMLEDLDREQARFDRNPPRYIDGVYKRYGFRGDGEDGDEFAPVELEAQVKQEVFTRFSAGRGLLNADAKTREREAANLNLIAASEMSEQNFKANKGYLHKGKGIMEKHKDATTLARKLDVLISLVGLQVEMQAKQLELQTKMAKAYGSMHYEGIKEEDLASQERINASSTAPRTNYGDAMNRKWSN